MTQFVDWDVAAATARALGKTGPAIGLEEATEAVSQLRECATAAAVEVGEYTKLTGHESPPVRVIDRGDWAAANIAGLRDVLNPLTQQMSGEPGPATKLVGARAAGAQAGMLLGYLSGKVLGQYEIFGNTNGQLLLVAPNVVETERQLDVNTNDFRMWICLHEATHAAQFGAVAWLRPYFMSEIDAFGMASQSQGDTDGAGMLAASAQRFAAQARKTLSVLSDSVRDPDADTSVIDLVTTDQQREVVDRLTALMTLLEGHADYVMDAIGPQVVPTVATIRERFDQRRAAGGPVQRIVKRLLGMDVKLKQYVQGKQFVKTVVEAVGITGFNKVWDQPANLPSMAEITDPQLWVHRVAS